MKLKNYIFQHITYLILAIIEKFWLTLVVGWVFIASLKGVEFIPDIANFFHSVAPAFFPSFTMSSDFQINSDNPLGAIIIMSTIGIPLTTFFLLTGFIVDIIFAILKIDFSIKNFLRKNIIIVYVLLFCISLTWVLYVILVDNFINVDSLIFSAFMSVVIAILTFIYVSVVAIIPGFFLYFFADKSLYVSK